MLFTIKDTTVTCLMHKINFLCFDVHYQFSLRIGNALMSEFVC